MTIVDDGLIPGALGSRPFDGEGLATRRTVLVRDGVLESYLLDSYSAPQARAGRRPTTPRATAAGWAWSTTNLMLLPGTDAAGGADRARCKSGLYVTELIGFGVNGVTGDYSRGAVGLWIENGELAYPVEEVTVAGNLLEMFAAHRGHRQRPRPARPHGRRRRSRSAAWWWPGTERPG